MLSIRDTELSDFINCNNPTFNPIDKIIELYEKRLQDKDDEIALLKSLLEKK